LATLRIGLSLNVIGLVVLAGAHSWLLLASALVLLSLGQGLAMPTLTTLVAGRSRQERRGGTLGLQQSAGGLARIVGPAIGGLLFARSGVPAPYLAGAAAVGVALIVLLPEHEQILTPA
jgi:MFS family permease